MTNNTQKVVSDIMDELSDITLKYSYEMCFTALIARLTENFRNQKLSEYMPLDIRKKEINSFKTEGSDMINSFFSKRDGNHENTD